MASLFKKYCQICGIETGGNIRLVRFGKSFCSEGHARGYIIEQRKAETLERRMIAGNSIRTRRGGGCC